jgi:hypothetical protein
MELENKGTEVPKETEVAKATEVTSNQPEKTIPVDIYGETIELPLSKAKAIIAKRDEKTQGYKQLQEKVTKAEAQAKQEAERASLLEAMKKSSVEEVEAMASKKYVEKLEKIQNQVVNKELESSLLSNDEFIKESLPDAIKLLKGDFDFQVNEEGDKVVTKDGKEVKEVVRDWVLKKEIFRRAKGATSTGAKTQGKTQVKQERNLNEGLAKGLGKLLGG